MPWYYAPLFVTTWGVALGLWRRDQLLLVAAFFLSVDHVGTMMLTPDQSEILTVRPWAAVGILDWLCALAILGHRVGRPQIALAALFFVSLCSHLCYGAHEVCTDLDQSYDSQVVEYQAQLPYWWTTFAVAVCQCGLLMGYAGGSGGKRGRSTSAAWRRSRRLGRSLS